MDAIKKLFNVGAGARTYILCGLAVLVGVAEYVGFDVVQEVTKENALGWLWSGVVGGTIRGAIGRNS
jgi:hypothetical protein